MIHLLALCDRKLAMLFTQCCPPPLAAAFPHQSSISLLTAIYIIISIRHDRFLCTFISWCLYGLIIRRYVVIQVCLYLVDSVHFKIHHLIWPGFILEPPHFSCDFYFWTHVKAVLAFSCFSCYVKVVTVSLRFFLYYFNK